MMSLKNSLLGGQIGKPVLNDPANLGGMIAQWKSDSLGLSDTNPVSSWADSTGNGKTATQGTGSLQPLYRTNQFGTVAAVQFDGVDDFLQFPTILSQIAHSVLMVFKSVNSGVIRNALYTRGTPGAGRIQLDHASINQVRIDDPSGAPSQASNAFATDMGTTALLLSITIGANYAFYENKTSRGTGVWTGGANFIYDGMGLLNLGGTASLFAEICVFNKALSSTDITDIYDAYFKPKYGLP